MNIERVEMYVLTVNGEDKAPPYETLEEAQDRAEYLVNDESSPELMIRRTSAPAELWNYRRDTGRWHLWWGVRLQ